jgi:negative regulator of flagellin synthesis FlgM
MKVENKVGSSLPHVDTAKTGKASSKSSLENLIAPQAGGTDNNIGGSSKVDVSDRAQMMQKAKEIASQSGIDEVRVARLQKLIDDGKYKTDAAAIADRLVDEHMSFND